MSDQRYLLEWTVSDVCAWLASIGMPQYEAEVRGNDISGDVLSMMTPELLKELGITSIGNRLAILKGVYLIKIAQNIEVEPEHYIPPSASYVADNVSVDSLFNIVKRQENRLRDLEDENRRLSENLSVFSDDHRSERGSTINGGSVNGGSVNGSSIRSGTNSSMAGSSHIRPPFGSHMSHAPSTTASETNSPGTQGSSSSFKWDQYNPPTRQDGIESPQPSPSYPAPQRSHMPQPSPTKSDRNASLRPPNHAQHSDTNLGPSSYSPSASSISSQQNHPPSHAPPPVSASGSTSSSSKKDSSDNLKSFKVSLDDPTWKVLPAALKKYRINNDTWQNYAMFICYGPTGSRIERCLSYDEKPLLLFQKLKDAKKNPVFMLKHIKDIRSPIAVAQQKHAARKASMSASSLASSVARARDEGSSSTPPVPANAPKLEVSLGGNANWPDVLSPMSEKKELEEVPNGASGALHAGSDPTKTREVEGGIQRETPIPLIGASYAVAIYPYMAEQEDEFDVVVGDTFVIVSRARGWWVVQRDPLGSGILDSGTSQQGWVPAGCLLETSVPVAADQSGPSTSKTPILPLHIVSTSFPGIALTEYVRKGEEELDLKKDDTLRVFKRYNHWSYAVKEDGGDRGWVPSWFIGKVTGPNTPGTNQSQQSAPGTSGLSSLDVDSANQNIVSPMSSAFPMPGRTTTVI